MHCNAMSKVTCKGTRSSKWTSKVDRFVENGATRCASHVGRLGGRQPLLWSRRECGGSAAGAVPELMHALGFLHEHNRADRDDHVGVDYANVEDGRRHHFRKYDDDQVDDLGVPYDTGELAWPTTQSDVVTV